MALYVNWRLDTGIVTSNTVAAEADYLRRVGDAHHRAAEVVTLLAADGWLVNSLGLSVSVSAYHPAVRTHAVARKRLTGLGINPSECSIETTRLATIPKLFPSLGSVYGAKG